MLMETGILYAVLAASSVRSNIGKGEVKGEVMCVNSAQNHIVLSVSNPANKIIETAIARDLSSVKEVRHVLAENAEGNLLVWVAVDNPTAEVRERIFNKQFEIIEGFPEISFDFNLISAKDRAIGEVSSAARVIYTREG